MYQGRVVSLSPGAILGLERFIIFLLLHPNCIVYILIRLRSKHLMISSINWSKSGWSYYLVEWDSTEAHSQAASLCTEAGPSWEWSLCSTSYRCQLPHAVRTSAWAEVAGHEAAGSRQPSQLALHRCRSPHPDVDDPHPRQEEWYLVQPNPSASSHFSGGARSDTCCQDGATSLRLLLQF